METHRFETAADFKKWAKNACKFKLQRYDRIPIGKQTWTYGDGHVVETEYGEKGGNLLVNLGYILAALDGKLKSPGDVQKIEDIDARGGLAFAINFGD
ncbi:hypothetical protein FHX10_004551 [Rhizobium sp. BK591]|uniref:hypothetical protein n=1 Tax=Rhizobium sp. BK591 TaxID=2586985 RepID=UPI00160E7551|nr:hypothetical protein [Rhizobium sp. BK591]MBB3745014.1 hypothetical protein [Rhizobium sp. BK591]